MRDNDQQKVLLSATVPPDLKKSLKILAVEENIRMNRLIQEAILDLFKKYKNKRNNEMQ